MPRVLAVLFVVSLVLAGPSKGPKDIEHPRSPGTPLEFAFTPFWCNQYSGSVTDGSGRTGRTHRR